MCSKSQGFYGSQELLKYKTVTTKQLSLIRWAIDQASQLVGGLPLDDMDDFEDRISDAREALRQVREDKQMLSALIVRTNKR